MNPLNPNQQISSEWWYDK